MSKKILIFDKYRLAGMRRSVSHVSEAGRLTEAGRHTAHPPLIAARENTLVFGA
jgi:hypothetical protein